MVDQPPPAPDSAETTSSRAAPVYVLCAALLLAPFVALLWVSSYAKDSPRLWGFPFFYWYQFMWVLISAALTYVAYLLVRSVQRRRPELQDRQVRR